MSEIQKVEWQDIRSEVNIVNSQFAELIDELSPDSKLPLYVAKYDYGEIIENGFAFFYPDNRGKVLTLDNIKDRQFQHDFSYVGIGTPAGIVLDKSLEIFIESGSRIIPRKVYTSGDIFALWGKLQTNKRFHPTPVMKTTAGARSIFMLPNISDQFHFLKLRDKLNIKIEIPNELEEQWSLFRAITKKKQSNWQVKVLLLTTDWMDLIRNDSAWNKLYCYLLQQAWLNSSYERNQIFYDHALSRIMEMKNLKPNPYLVDTFKYILSIALGAFPGFTIATDETYMPTKLLQEIFIEDYGLKHYWPTLFHPIQYDFDSSDFPIYYSLQYPTTLIFSPKSRKLTTTLQDLRDMINIYEKFNDAINTGFLGLKETVIGEFLKRINFLFFHSKPDKHGEILPSELIGEYDNRYMNHMYMNGTERRISSAGAFLRGCIGLFPNKMYNNEQHN